MIRVLIFTFILIVTAFNFLSAEEHFLTLKYDNVNLRQGPSKNYPIKIFYKKKIFLLKFRILRVIGEK